MSGEHSKAEFGRAAPPRVVPAARPAAQRAMPDRKHQVVYERLVAEYRDKHGKDPGNWSRLVDQAKAEVAAKVVGKRSRRAPRLFDGIMLDAN